MDLYAEFESIVKALDAARIQFAVCGGFAMAVHGVARATKDIDLLVPPEETERIIHTLKP
ncbi:MAG: nucleotidyl transferase AbiEii/AbiGii toxin family protein, partial [Planctomycetes bacterium]|nr:nucleotidyl transferase AbiEii/AbiGii toxin family protein [Planctomycetota bacterium]